MSRILKKASAILIVLVMLLSVIPFSGAIAAENGVCGENLTWSLSNDGVLTVSGNGEMDNYLISKEPWYSVRSEIGKIIVSEGVQTVGNSAFYDCSNLTEVSLPLSIVGIGSNAFADCESLEEIVLPANLKVIGSNAFYASGIRNIDIPASVTSIGKNAFGWCDSLSSISVNEGNTAYSSDENGVLYDKNKSRLIKYPCVSPVNDFIIPGTVATVEEYAFENAYNLRNIGVSASVETIGEFAFFNAYTENIIVVPENNNYSSDGSGVLFDKNKTTLIQFPVNSKLTGYIIPESVTTIADSAFHNCNSIENITVSGGIKTLGDEVFYYCENLEYIHIPAETTEIGVDIIDYTTAYICSDTDNCYAKEYADENGYDFVVCGEHTADRGVMASGSCGDYTVWVLYDDGELVISGSGAMGSYDEADIPWTEFKNDIKKVTVNEGVTSLSAYAFSDCANLKNVKLSDTVADIGAYAFENCSVIRDIVIPAGVTSVNADAFVGCTNLLTVRYNGTAGDWCGIQFRTAGSNPAYFADEFYIGGTPVIDVVIPEGTESVGTHTFAGVESLKNIVLPESLKSINAGAFRECTGLSEITLPENLEAVQVEAFAGCTGFEYIHIPESVKTIERGAIPETVDFICSDAENTVAKAYADANGIAFSFCGNHKVIGVSLPEIAEIENKSTYQLEAVINPENPTDKTLTWESDNTSVAKVDKNGLITAVSVGEANITVTTNDGGFTATCKVTVVPRVFDITWVVNGVGTVQSFAEGAVIPAPEDPVRTGYAFKGWSTDVPEIMPSRNLVFSATWEANYYDAVFNAEGGSWADGSDKKIISSQFDSEIEIPEDPARQGYSFAGWNPVVGIMDNINGKSFDAVWVADSDTTYKVETYTMGTDGKYTLETGVYAGETDSEVTAEYSVEKGFVLNSDKSVLSGVIAADGSLVLAVYLDRISYEIVINGKTVECVYGQQISEPEVTSVPEGHRHSGWSDENGEAVIFPLTAGDNIPEKINPVFSKCIYKVTWNVDGATTEISYEYGETIVRIPDPVKDGYTFTGWTPAVPSAMPAYDITFTAVFDKNSYTCADCGDVFDDETEYNEHIAYEQAKKNVRISIKNNPGTAKIKFGETIKLTAVTTANIEGTKIFWYVDGEKQGEGESFSLTFESGTKTVSVRIVDENGNPLKDASGNEISDEQQVNVNSCFWQKIVSFFKNLFRMNRTVVQSVFTNIF